MKKIWFLAIKSQFSYKCEQSYFIKQNNNNNKKKSQNRALFCDKALKEVTRALKK